MATAAISDPRRPHVTALHGGFVQSPPQVRRIEGPSDDQDRCARVGDHIAGDTAEDQLIDARKPACPGDDQVGIAVVCQSEDLVSRIRATRCAATDSTNLVGPIWFDLRVYCLCSNPGPAGPRAVWHNAGRVSRSL